MTDARELVVRYLEQRMRSGEQTWVLPEPAPTPAEPSMERTGRHRRLPEAMPAEAPARSAKTDWRRGVPDIPGPGLVVAAPPKDLFTDDPLGSATLADLAAMVRSCTKCRLCEARTNAVPGEGPTDARLAVVGEGPGATEDATGRPFVGRAGELLTDILKAIEMPREQVFICNVVKCRPPENRKPAPDEIAACLPYLHRQLEILRPAVILAMGGTAAEALLETKLSISGLRGKLHEFRGVPVIVTYHPAALLRNPHWKKPTWDDVRIARRLLDRR